MRRTPIAGILLALPLAACDGATTESTGPGLEAGDSSAKSGTAAWAHNLGRDSAADWSEKATFVYAFGAAEGSGWNLGYVAADNDEDMFGAVVQENGTVSVTGDSAYSNGTLFEVGAVYAAWFAPTDEIVGWQVNSDELPDGFNEITLFPASSLSRITESSPYTYYTFSLLFEDIEGTLPVWVTGEYCYYDGRSGDLLQPPKAPTTAAMNTGISEHAWEDMLSQVSTCP